MGLAVVGIGVGAGSRSCGCGRGLRVSPHTLPRAFAGAIPTGMGGNPSHSTGRQGPTRVRAVTVVR